jgi:hypothetical protein
MRSHTATPLALFNTVAVTRADTSSGFECEEPALNEFFRQYARQGHSAGMSRTWVLRRPEARPELPLVLGYYTLTIATVEREELPADLLKGLGQYPIPVVRIGRLARDLRAKGLRTTEGLTLGEKLLQDAHLRALFVANQAGSLAITVDAKGPRAEAFYASFGYRPLRSAVVANAPWPRGLFLPMETVRRATQDT